MNGLPYFAFYANDFVGGVKLFTAEEVGSYVLLLCYQWTNGPLPANQSDLDRIAGATVSQRVRNKFQETESGLINSRLEVERKRGIDKKKNALKRLHKYRKGRKSETRFDHVGETVSDTVAKPFCSDSDSVLSLDSTKAHGKAKRKPKAATAFDYPPDFLRIVDAYPNVPSKKEAFNSWRKTANRPTVEEVVSKIEENRARNPQWQKDNGAYIPALTVWINQRRWEAKLPGDQGPTQSTHIRPSDAEIDRMNDEAAREAHQMLMRNTAEIAANAAKMRAANAKR